MNKSDIRDTLNREIEYRLGLIDQAKRGVLLHLETPEKVQTWVDQQELAIYEVGWIASKLHIKL